MKLQIARWAETYESNTVSNRPKKEMQYFFHRVGDVGTGRKMLERHPEGMMFYGIWNALCEITGQLYLEERGLLIRGNGDPYSVEDLFLLIGGCDQEQFERAIKFFLAPRPGWLVDLDAKAEAPSRRVVEMPTKSKPMTIDEWDQDDPIKVAALAAAEAMTSRHLLDKTHDAQTIADVLVKTFGLRKDAEAKMRHVAAKHAEMCGKRAKDGGWLGREGQYWPRLWEWVAAPEAIAPLTTTKASPKAERDLLKEAEAAWDALGNAEREKLLRQASEDWKGNPSVDPLEMAKWTALGEWK